MTDSKPHIKLYIPGPVEVLPEVLQAQTVPMIGHRMPECVDLIKDIYPKLQKVFRTEGQLFILPSSGSGLWEAGVRNLVAKKALCCVSGAFSSKFHQVVVMNGKEATKLDFEWGQPVEPAVVAEHLATGDYDALCVVHNETSTGTTNPIGEIAAAVRALPNGQDISILVDSVSGLSGAKAEMDEWDLDFLMTGAQKAFALPPGIAMCAVSERALAKAPTVPNRGYYFDFPSLKKMMDKYQTPSTPAVSLLNALNFQLNRIMEEGVEARWDRHMKMRDMTLAWAAGHGIKPYGDPKYASPTVSNLNVEGILDPAELNVFLRTKNMFLSNGYGSLKGKAMRISHMGDLYPEDMEELFAAIDEYLA